MKKYLHIIQNVPINLFKNSPEAYVLDYNYDID